MKSEFDSIANEIINNDIYKKLYLESHHGLTRYDHSLRVARKTYKVCKKLNLDYKSATKAALLHDFFSNEYFNMKKPFTMYKDHPYLAAMNAKKYFNISEFEEDIIKTHMFPLTKKKPQSKEALAVSLVDKAASMYEYTRYKFSMQMGVFILLIINILTVSHN